MKIDEIKEILKKERFLLKHRDEILYSKYSLEIQKKMLEDEILTAQIKNARYREFKSEKLVELAEKLGCLSILSLACFMSLKDMSPNLISSLLSGSFFTYFGGLSIYSYKLDLDEYKSDDDNYYNLEKIEQLEMGYEAAKENIDSINMELQSNSNSLTDIYNELLYKTNIKKRPTIQVDNEILEENNCKIYKKELKENVTK